MLGRRLGARISLFDAALQPLLRRSPPSHPHRSSVSLGNGPDSALRGRLAQVPSSPVLPLPSFVGSTTPVKGKKTKTVVKIQDLPQGRVHVDPDLQSSVALPNAEDAVPAAAACPPADPPVDQEPAYPTVILQARRNMQKLANCVLLTRLGGFYELYFDQADELGPLLNLKVAQKKTSAGPVSMVST